MSEEWTIERHLEAGSEKDLFVHHFRVGAPEQLDDEFAAWIAAAYEVGAGRRC